ncbi:GNAT family N-acetyltransferase [Jatrophihabitans lederbergiae]|uniref:GNAT family N-acetyltransferase n=1 Tax=Jatrophihabitans lederbergiae TaxID=3075547 RepID=UPI0037C02E43
MLIDDPGAWWVTCFAIDSRHRRSGVASALLESAVTFARDHGATAVEGHPVDVAGLTATRVSGSALYPARRCTVPRNITPRIANSHHTGSPTTADATPAGCQDRLGRCRRAAWRQVTAIVFGTGVHRLVSAEVASGRSREHVQLAWARGATAHVQDHALSTAAELITPPSPRVHQAGYDPPVVE